MELALLAQGLVAVLRPFLKGLLRGGEQTAEEAGAAVGEKGRDIAGRIWGRLFPKIEESPSAEKAVERAADDIDDDRARVALELEVEDILAAHPELVEELTSLHEEAEQAGIVAGRDVIQVSGDRGAVVAGRDVRAGRIDTGGRSDPKQ